MTVSAKTVFQDFIHIMEHVRIVLIPVKPAIQPIHASVALLVIF